MKQLSLFGDEVTRPAPKKPSGGSANLIDKVSGRGTWVRNPFVFAYSYELVK